MDFRHNGQWLQLPVGRGLDHLIFVRDPPYLFLFLIQGRNAAISRVGETMGVLVDVQDKCQDQQS